MATIISLGTPNRTRILVFVSLLLILGVTVIPIADAARKPDKGKPSRGMRQITFFQNGDPSLWSANLPENPNELIPAAFTAYVQATEDGDLVTFVRANRQGEPDYQLCFVGEDWEIFEDFQPGNDLEMHLSWDTPEEGAPEKGLIEFYFWFGDRCRLVAESGTFIRDNDLVYHVALSEVQIFTYNPSIKGAPSNRYIPYFAEDPDMRIDITFDFTIAGE